MKSVMVAWLYSADQFAQNTPLTEIAEHAALHGFNDEPIDVLVLHGHQFIPTEAVEALRDQGFRLRNVEAVFRTVAARYPSLRARYANVFFECFLRWIVIKEMFGTESVLAWDADIFLNERVSRLHKAYEGSTFTSSSTCFVAISDPAWLTVYEQALAEFEREPGRMIARIRQQLIALCLRDPMSFTTSFFGHKMASALGSDDAWERFFDSTPEELFVDYLARVGYLPHTVDGQVADFVLCPQPLLKTHRAWHHPFGPGLPTEPLDDWVRVGGRYVTGGQPLAFVHFQGALFRACAVHQLLGSVLGEPAFLYDEFYCPPDRRRGRSVDSVFRDDRATFLATARAKHGEMLANRWGDLFSERVVARRYLIEGSLTDVLNDYGCPSPVS